MVGAVRKGDGVHDIGMPGKAGEIRERVEYLPRLSTGNVKSNADLAHCTPKFSEPRIRQGMILGGLARVGRSTRTGRGVPMEIAVDGTVSFLSDVAALPIITGSNATRCHAVMLGPEEGYTPAGSCGLAPSGGRPAAGGTKGKHYSEIWLCEVCAFLVVVESGGVSGGGLSDTSIACSSVPEVTVRCVR
ncbi:hypothetical protein GCM10010341_65720 [Streptomyces noursei]|nr:hypothetical protein GCM10010341_65720 [Streptomyces noursei]